MKGNGCIALNAKKTTVKDKIYSRILQYIAVHQGHGIGILIKKHLLRECDRCFSLMIENKIFAVGVDEYST